MKEKSADMPLMLAVFALLILGIVMISSVSVYPSFTVTSKYLEHANNYFYISRSAAHAVVAIGAFIGVSLLPYTLFEKYSKYIYGGSILLLGYVLIAGEVYNGAK
jgi:cell division protein FtsW (lipid II flippase)